MAEQGGFKDIMRGGLIGGAFAAIGAAVVGGITLLCGGPVLVMALGATAVFGWLGSGISYVDCETSGRGNGSWSFRAGMAATLAVAACQLATGTPRPFFDLKIGQKAADTFNYICKKQPVVTQGKHGYILQIDSSCLKTPAAAAKAPTG